MMITIHGFPAKTKYQDVKMLIKQECSINDFILDNLVNDTDGTKKVRIGLTDNTEGYKVMKCLDGYRMAGNFVLKAIPIGKAVSSLPPQPSGFDSRSSYPSQPRNDYSNAPRNDYMSQPANDYNNQGSHGTGLPHSHGGIHGSSGVHGSVGSHGAVGSHGSRLAQGGPHVSSVPQGSIDSMNRPSPWVSGGGNSSQWNTPMVAQVPQNTFEFTSPSANVNPSYGQQQGHPRPSFHQSRADQGYGYTPKSNVPEVVPDNSRYRWVRKAEQEPTVSKSHDCDEDSASPSSADDMFNEKSQDIPNESEKDPSNIFDEKSQDIPNESEKDPSNELVPPEKTLSKKARKRQQAKLRDISKLNGAKRRRLYFWLKQGKSFMEARELCEIGVKKIPEYPALKAEKKKKAREIALRRMSPERQARAIKVDRLKGRGVPGAPAEPRPRCIPIRVRFVDQLGLMSQEKIEMLQDKILELMDAETDGNIPSFVGCAAPYGSLLLSCVDAQTLEWLENHLPSFQLWEGAQVKISNLSESKPAIAIAYVPDPNLDGDTILNMLKSQNQGFDFSDWWITSIKPDPPAGQTVTFNIDNSSVEKLPERNNFLYLGVKKIKIRIKNYKAKAPPGPSGVLPVRQEAKGKMFMPPKGQRGMQPMDQMRMPPKGQRGMQTKGQQGMQPKGQQGMQPKGQRGMQPMDQMSILPKGQRGMQPKGQWGMQPMDQMSTLPKGQRGMQPKGQRGMQPKGQRGMQPMDQMSMLPMWQRDMQPMYQMGMSPMNMGQMRPMDIGYMGQMDMGYMGPMYNGCMGPMGFAPTGTSYSPDFSQPEYFGGGNHPKHYGGGKNHNNRQMQGGPRNNAGRKPKPGKRNKKNK